MASSAACGAPSAGSIAASPFAATAATATTSNTSTAAAAAASDTTDGTIVVLRSPLLDLVTQASRTQRGAIISGRLVASIALSDQEAMTLVDIPGSGPRRMTVISARAALATLTPRDVPNGVSTMTTSPGATGATGTPGAPGGAVSGAKGPAPLTGPTLRITAATLGSTPVTTQFGMLSLPVWQFSVDGVGGPIQVVALDRQELGTTSAATVPAATPSS